jgi:hypothetical protein
MGLSCNLSVHTRLGYETMRNIAPAMSEVIAALTY